MLTLAQVGGVFLIFVLCPILGALPLTGWIVEAIAHKKLSQIGTGNVGVSAAFYHGGKTAGILAVLAEAGKGVVTVLLVRQFFPLGSSWEIIGLMALVMGRYWGGRGAGTTNAFWGFFVHDWVATAIAFFLSGISFTIFRQRQQGRVVALLLMPLMLFLLHPQSGRGLAAALLCGLLYWILNQMPDDLDLKPDSASGQSLFTFFRGERSLIALDKPLSPQKVGGKAATLAQLQAWGYPVPGGWVLPPGDDPEILIQAVPISEQEPYAVRSSAIGEDSAQASAAGQYLSVLQLTSRYQLAEAIARCFASYNAATARQYREDRGLEEEAMAVIVQRQVQGVYSGVAFSRDPVTQEPGVVVIEAIAGPTSAVVSGKITPEQYRAQLPEQLDWQLAEAESWKLPPETTVTVRSATTSGDVPGWLLEQVAYLARHLEARYHGIPQDIEWTYDGEQLWLLQARPITTMLPIWTRKIAAEVIPGAIRPLTWSINQPLTCGVWGELFTLVLGDRATDLNFDQTATLHHAHAYFNASLLGEIFLRMGLPPESLEFLTRGAKFSKPPLKSTLKSAPGLWRLLRREGSLEKDFARDQQALFGPVLRSLPSQPPETLTPLEIWSRIELLLQQLEKATYYSILAPLSAAIRQGIFKVADEDLDYAASPEIAALAALRAQPQPTLDDFLKEYGYLSQVGTDIAVPTWREDPRPIEALLRQPQPRQEPTVVPTSGPNSGKRQRSAPKSVQNRVDLKGRVTETYSRLLAELRWSFVALEQQWLALGWLEDPGDIFFLERAEIEAQIQAIGAVPQRLEGLTAEDLETLKPAWRSVLQTRKTQFSIDQTESVATLVYGQEPPRPSASLDPITASANQLQGIGASAGQVEGTIRIFRQVTGSEAIPPQTIIVVPYTDSGWAPLLAQAAGVIAEVGGRLSHGAIVAREYGIPAVMDLTQATQRLREGQRVRLDGTTGTVTIVKS